MNLIIDHQQHTDKTTITIFDPQNENIVDSKTVSLGFFMSEKIVQNINQLLVKNEIDKRQITAVIVNPGPGSYTTTRICTTVANAIGYSLNVPVVDITDFKNKKNVITDSKFSNPVLPKYSNPPVITQKRAR